jgi:hypothetical protein
MLKWLVFHVCLRLISSSAFSVNLLQLADELRVLISCPNRDTSHGIMLLSLLLHPPILPDHEPARRAMCHRK